VVVMPSMVKETSLTTVLADDEPPPPLALLLADDDEEVEDVAPVCDVAEVDALAEVDWVPVGERSELTELIDMEGLALGIGMIADWPSHPFNVIAGQSRRRDVFLIVSR